MRRLTLTIATALLLLAGCTSEDGAGSSEPADPSSESSAAPTNAPPQEADAPECGDVWQAGKTLPADYTSCVEEGESVEPEAIACTDASSLVVHLDRFYAVTGQEIVEPDEAPLQDTDAFGQAYETCTGE